MIDNWINCYLICGDDYEKIIGTPEFFRERIKLYESIDNDMEYMDFVSYLYGFFQLSRPTNKWIIDKYLNPDQFFHKNMPSLPRLPRKNSASCFCKADGSQLTTEIRNAVLVMAKKEKTTEEISFFYNIPLSTVDKILSKNNS
jgi:hypothetical protein